MKKTKTLISLLPLLTAAAFLILKRDISSVGVIKGLQLCCYTVIPAVFPFMVLSRLFYRLGVCAEISDLLKRPLYRLFGIQGEAGSIILLSLVSGYPVCTSLCNTLYRDKKISKTEAQVLICYTNNATPAFIIGFIGTGVFGNVSSGVIMYFSVILSALIYGMISGQKLKRKNKAFLPSVSSSSNGFFSVFTDSVSSSCLSILNVCGFIVVFSVISSTLSSFSFVSAPYCSLFLFILEITVGVTECAPLYNLLSPSVFFALCAAFVSFSGMCVMSQVASSAPDCGIKGYLKAKILQSVITFLFAFLGFLIFLN